VAVGVSPRRPLLRERREALVVLLCIAAAAVVGWAAAFHPTLVGLPVATVLCLPLLMSPRLRVLWVVFGALVFFGTTDELTPGKLAYLYGIGFALVGALYHARSRRETSGYRLLMPLFWASAAFAVLAAVSLPVSILNGIPQTDWLRDLAPYAMFAAAPLFAHDAQDAFGRRALEGILAVAGIAAAVSFGVKWITVRGIADLSALPTGFPSTLLAAALAAYGASQLLQGSSRRGTWLMLTATTLSLMFVTGTRTTLILLVAPFAIAFGSPRGLSRRAFRLLVALPLLAIAIFISLKTIVAASDGEAEVLEQRLSLFRSSGGANDRSYLDRLTQHEAAREVFWESPILGAGPGVRFVWRDTFGVRFETPVLDSPITFLSKFGLVGLGWLLIVIGALAAFYRSLRRGGRDPTIAELALLGYCAVTLGYATLQVPFEDKGFAPALVLLLALALRERRDREEAASEADAPDLMRGG
jgi:hypothetical protein